MYQLFLVCALIGCTFLVLQFIMNLLGFVGDAVDLGDMGDGDAGGADVDIGDAGDLPDADAGGDGHHSHDHSGLRLAKVLTFQTLVAFLAFFGLGGWAVLESGRSNFVAVSVGLATGVGAMFGVAYLLHSMRKLEEAGNTSIFKTVGCRGRVYLRIPANNEGVGKATISSQGRTMELKARTSGQELKTGETVKVVRVLDRDTIEVVSISDTEAAV